MDIGDVIRFTPACAREEENAMVVWEDPGGTVLLWIAYPHELFVEVSAETLSDLEVEYGAPKNGAPKKANYMIEWMKTYLFALKTRYSERVESGLRLCLHLDLNIRMVDMKDMEKFSLLMLAAQDEFDLATCRVLIAQGADVNAQSDDGTTPLMQAIRVADDVEKCKLFLENGAYPYAKTIKDISARDIARPNNQPEIRKLLEDMDRMPAAEWNKFKRGKIIWYILLDDLPKTAGVTLDKRYMCAACVLWNDPIHQRIHVQQYRVRMSDAAKFTVPGLDPRLLMNRNEPLQGRTTVAWKDVHGIPCSASSDLIPSILENNVLPWIKNMFTQAKYRLSDEQQKEILRICRAYPAAILGIPYRWFFTYVQKPHLNGESERLIESDWKYTYGVRHDGYIANGYIYDTDNEGKPTSYLPDGIDFDLREARLHRIRNLLFPFYLGIPALRALLTTCPMREGVIRNSTVDPIITLTLRDPEAPDNYVVKYDLKHQKDDKLSIWLKMEDDNLDLTLANKDPAMYSMMAGVRLLCEHLLHRHKIIHQLTLFDHWLSPVSSIYHAQFNFFLANTFENVPTQPITTPDGTIRTFQSYLPKDMTVDSMCKLFDYGKFATKDFRALGDKWVKWVKFVFTYDQEELVSVSTTNTELFKDGVNGTDVASWKRIIDTVIKKTISYKIFSEFFAHKNVSIRLTKLEISYLNIYLYYEVVDRAESNAKRTRVDGVGDRKRSGKMRVHMETNELE